MPLEAEGFEFCPESDGQSIALRFGDLRSAIDYVGRSSDEGKKIKMARRWFYALFTLLRYRLFKRASVGQVNGLLRVVFKRCSA